MLMTGVIVNPLSSTVCDIRKASSTSFKNGFDQLDEHEQVSVLSEMEQLASSLFARMRQQLKSVDDLKSTTDFID